jgi:hypothetical protein
MGETLFHRLARLFWEALDRVDYVVMLARCQVADLIYGPEPPTPADKQREAEHERLRTAFPFIDFDGTMAVDGERRAQAEETPIAPPTGSGGARPRPAAPANPSAP